MVFHQIWASEEVAEGGHDVGAGIVASFLSLFLVPGPVSLGTTVDQQRDESQLQICPSRLEIGEERDEGAS